MVQLTIRCHPLVPVETEELERWLDLEVEASGGRAGGDDPAIALDPDLTSADLGIGWLLELELPEEAAALARSPR